MHVPGKMNTVADALSRRPDLAAVMVDTTEFGVAMLQRVRAAQEQAGEASWEATAGLARAGKQGFCMRDGLVCRTREGNSVSVVVPDVGTLR